MPSSKTVRNQMDDKPYRETLVFRGHTYVLEEIEIGLYEDIEKQATVTTIDPTTDRKVETINGEMRQQLLMQAMLIEGIPAGGLRKIKTREMVNLRAKMNEMCFGELPNEFVKADKNGAKPSDKPDEADDEEGEEKGEG